MSTLHDFDEIRPYTAEEMPDVIEQLIADPMFRQAAEYAYRDIPFEKIAADMRSSKTILEFQRKMCYPLVMGIMEKQSLSLDLDFNSSLDKATPYTYISNHRDIILDSGLLSIMLSNNGMDTVEIAIGDNLLIYPWIKMLVRLNKSFIVQRGLSLREQLVSSIRMSGYIHYAITQKKQSVWIAQREGRAKDSDDKTQDSVLKMLAIGKDGDPIESLKEINIVPLSISYEYDPCDYLKAKEFQMKRDNPDYRKTTDDDLTNMLTGLTGYKGHVMFRTSACINGTLDRLDKSLNKKECFKQIAGIIDRQIFAGYEFYPCNYIAYDAINGTGRFKDKYTDKQHEEFNAYLQRQLDKIDMPDKDEAFLKEKMLQMYANPLTNHLNNK